jgi:hypothetical protein
MRLRIELNPVYAQQLLQNSNFRLSLTLTEDKYGNITKLWIENTLENNDEITFRALALNMVKNHFCVVFQELTDNVEIVNDDNVMPTYLIRTVESRENSLIASIIEFEL